MRYKKDVDDISIHKIQIILYDIGEEEVKSMKKIIIGRQDTTSRIKTNTWILFPIITFGVLIFLFNHFELIEVASFIGICVVLLGIIKYIYSLNSFVLDSNPKDPLVVLEISDDTLEYIDKRDNKDLFVVYLKDIEKIRLGYRQRWFRMQHVFDLKFDFLTTDGSLYTLYSEGILSKQGDYEKAIAFLETKNIEIYDPQNIRPLLSLASVDFQFSLRQRLWDGEHK